MKKYNLLFKSNRNIYQRKDGGKVDLMAVLTGVLPKLYKDGNGELLALLQSEDATAETITAKILELDKARIASFSGKFQEGYAKAKGEIRAEMETAIKSKFKIEEGAEGYDLTGNELVDFIVAQKTGEGSPTGGADLQKLTADQIKALPGYHAIEKETKKAIKDLTETHTKALKDLEESFKSESVFSEFTKEAIKALQELKPVIPGSAKVAQTLEAKFLEEFKNYNIRKNEDGTFTFLDKEGKIIEDGHGHSVDWKEHVKSKAADYYEFQENNGGANAGEQNKKPGGGEQSKPGAKATYPQGITPPKDFGEYTKLVNNKEIPLDQRLQIQQAYKDQNSATGDL